MRVTDPELPEGAADGSRPGIGRLGPGLGRIVLADVEDLFIDLTAMHRQDLVLHHVGVVVHGIVPDLARDFDQLGGHLNTAQARDLGVRTGVRLLGARRAQDGHDEKCKAETVYRVAHYFTPISA